MNTWHCGTTHCIGGWLCVLNDEAKKAEAVHGTELTAFALLPNYSHLFYLDNEDALEELEKIATK